MKICQFFNCPVIWQECLVMCDKLLEALGW